MCMRARAHVHMTSAPRILPSSFVGALPLAELGHYRGLAARTASRGTAGGATRRRRLACARAACRGATLVGDGAWLGLGRAA